MGICFNNSQIKGQEKTIKELELSLKRHEHDLSELCSKTKESEEGLEDLKLKLVTQVRAC